jgi:hypothetical protein
MKRKGMWISIVLFSLLLLVGIAFVATSRAGYETAAYEVKEKDGAFEIREYAPHEVATTSMKLGSQNGSFGRLFRYISGGNQAEKKIAMTTPVFMPATSEGEMEEMQFVVPAEVTKEGAPAPSQDSVSLKRNPGGPYAVLRHRGWGRGEERREKLEQLRKEIEKRGLKAKGDPMFAGYDPPWTPGFLRRNEVLIPIE